jgi:VCBS repeat-containing protein
MSGAHRRPCKVLLTAVTTLVLGLTLAPEPASATLLASNWTGFESGYAWGWSAKENVSVDPAYAKTGLFGVQAVSTPSQAGFLTWGSSRIAPGGQYGRIAGWVRVDSYDPADKTVDVLTLKNAYGAQHFDFFLDDRSGKWRYDLFRDDNAYSTMSAEVGEWYYVEALVDFGGETGSTYTAQVRINGVDQPTIQSTQQVGTTVRSAWFGDRNAFGKTHTRSYDSLSVETGDSPFSFTR